MGPLLAHLISRRRVVLSLYNPSERFPRLVITPIAVVVARIANFDTVLEQLMFREPS
jgi:hypothetical protein